MSEIKPLYDVKYDEDPKIRKSQLVDMINFIRFQLECRRSYSYDKTINVKKEIEELKVEHDRLYKKLSDIIEQEKLEKLKDQIREELKNE